MGFFPYMGEILWVFLTFMEVFPIPPLSRGRSGGGWGIYVAVVLGTLTYLKPLDLFCGERSDPERGLKTMTVVYVRVGR